MLKRGYIGIFHHFSKKNLHHYIERVLRAVQCPRNLDIIIAHIVDGMEYDD